MGLVETARSLFQKAAWGGLRVAFIGNQGNNAYRMCKWGRMLGVEARLFHCPSQYNRERSLPELVDPELASGYPDWIKVLETKDYFDHNPAAVASINSTNDAIVTTGEYGIHQLRHFHGPVLAHLPVGGDVGVTPWRDFTLFPTAEAQERQRLYLLSLGRYNVIVTANPMTQAKLEHFGLKGRVVMWTSPEDVISNREKVDRQVYAELVARYQETPRVFMWLSRLMLDKQRFANKAVDFFIKALARLLEERPDCPVRVIMGDHGPDREEARSLVERLGLGPRVEWVEHQPYTHLLAFLSLPNAVLFDELDPAGDWIGGIGRDALSVGCVTVKSNDPRRAAYLYGPGCPVLHASSEEQCLQRMRQVLDDDFFQQQKKATLEWADKYMHYPLNVKKFYSRIARDVPRLGLRVPAQLRNAMRGR